MLIDNNSYTAIYRLFLLLILSVIVASCGIFSSDSNDGLNVDEWLISESEVVDGGPGIDGIPAIDSPRFDNVQNVNSFRDDRRITGIRMGDKLIAYPHQILDHHEIVNHEIDGEAVSVTFCPLTGTSVGAKRLIGGTTLEYGVSGLLYRNNLVMYDRNTGSVWSQMQMRSVGGEFSGTDINHVQLIETSWADWKAMYPDSEVLTTDTGFGRNYNIFVYGEGYTTNNNDILFPIRNEDDRLERKNRVHTLLPSGANEESEVQSYAFKDFGPETTIHEDTFSGNNYLIVGNNELSLMNSFRLETEFEQNLEFTPLDLSELPALMTDQHGNYWDAFGYALEGPDKGKQLTASRSFSGFWFAFADFYPNVNLVRF